MKRFRFRPSLEQLEPRDVPALMSFAVNEAISSVTLSGKFSFGSFGDLMFQQQGAGSLTTAVDGTIVADVDETNGTIRFLNATDLILANSGAWQPGIGGVLGNAAANFGASANQGGFTAVAAVRGAQVTFTSGTLVLGGSNPRTFDSTQLTGMVAAGSADYRFIPPEETGTAALAGLSASNMAGIAGSLNRTGTTLTLMIPVSVSYVVPIIPDVSATFIINGILQASATVAPVIPPGGGGLSDPTPQAIQAAGQIVQTLQRGGAKLAAFAFGETNADSTKDVVLAFRQRNGRLLVATLSGTNGGVVGAFQPFSQPLATGARVQLLLLNLNADPLLDIGVIINGGGTGIPRVSAFTVTGARLL
jgi:hypothetical protein